MSVSQFVHVGEQSSPNYHGCTACGKRITYRFAICSDCEKIYGRSAFEWPEWLRYSWNETQRQRRATKKTLRHEIQIEDFEFLDIN